MPVVKLNIALKESSGSGPEREAGARVAKTEPHMAQKAENHSVSADAVPERELLGMPFAESPFPMWIYDLETLAFLQVNDAAIKSYGYSREEFLRMTVLDIRPSHDISKFLHSWKHTHESTGEKWWHVGKNRKPFPVSITSWELTFHGRKAEVVLAKKESKSAAATRQKK